MRKSYFRIFLFACCIIVSCTSPDIDEIRIGEAAGMDRRDLVFVKKITGSEIAAFNSAGSSAGIRANMGIEVAVDFGNTDTVRELLKSRFNVKGFLVFLAQQNYNADRKKNIIAIFKSMDQFDILRIRKTEDRKRHRATAVIIDILKTWEKQFRFEITGADSYWVEASFVEKPADMNKFAIEIGTLCPEVLNDGSGKIEDIVSAMNKKKSFYLLFQ
jgi:hypothetical protein